MLKQIFRQESIDGGTGRMLKDVAGKPYYHWDADDRMFYTICYVMRRPVEQWIDDDRSIRQFEKTIYFDIDTVNTVKNLRGKMTGHYEGGGKHSVDEYDFKGMPVNTFRQVIDDYKHSEPDGTLERHHHLAATFLKLRRRSMYWAGP